MLASIANTRSCIASSTTSCISRSTRSIPRSASYLASKALEPLLKDTLTQGSNRGLTTIFAEVSWKQLLRTGTTHPIHRDSIFTNTIARIDTTNTTAASRSTVRLGRHFNTSSELKEEEMSTIITEEIFAKDFLSFLHDSPSHFHAVATSIELLKIAGFEAISEVDDWTTKLQPGGKYYFTRNQSTIIAFAVPPSHKVGSGFMILAAHTDSPVLKVKPHSATTKQGYVQLGVQPYGGGLWYSWFDRDLSVAGRVIVKKAGSSSSSGSPYGEFESRLVRINDPILRVSSLAIHLNREVNDKGFAPNKQNHLLPTLATAVRAQMEGTNTKADGNALGACHHPILLNLLAKELNVDVNNIADFELSLYDTAPARIGGVCKEFIYARGLDNLCMSFVCLRSLIDSLKDEANWKTENKIRICALFDNEEVGSDSFQGAGSTLLSTTLQRLNTCQWSSGKSPDHILPLEIAVRKSLLVSADMAHAVHPNYGEQHDENHRPALHGGLVVKENANQRYATSTLTAFALQQIADQHKIPIQKFVVRNDSACGSTIGPILATNTGIRTVDVGVPQLSMHSIREVCGVGDIYSAHRLLTAVYREFSDADSKLKVDGM